MTDVDPIRLIHRWVPLAIIVQHAGSVEAAGEFVVTVADTADADGPDLRLSS